MPSGSPASAARAVALSVSAEDQSRRRTALADAGYVAPQWATLFDNPAFGDHLSGRDILGGQLEWIHGRYGATLFGTNLTNQHYVGALNSGLRFAGDPRQYGVRLLVTF